MAEKQTPLDIMSKIARIYLESTFPGIEIEGLSVTSQYGNSSQTTFVAEFNINNNEPARMKFDITFPYSIHTKQPYKPKIN